MFDNVVLYTKATESPDVNGFKICYLMTERRAKQGDQKTPYKANRYGHVYEGSSLSRMCCFVDVQI